MSGLVVRELVTKLGFRVDKRALKDFDEKIRAVKRDLNDLSGELKNIARGVRNVGIGFTAFLTAPLTALGFASVKTASDLEKAKIALEVFLGSEEKALEMQKELLKFARVTPFQALGIQETAGQLLAAGIESDKLIDTLNALGNAAKGNSAIFQRLVLNFAQVKTQGKLTGRDLRDFLVGQVPLVQLLAKELNVAEDQIRSMTSAGQISFADVENAFFTASKEGGFFFDLMKKQSRTLAGRFSNLLDTLTQLLDVFGQAIDRTFKLKENLQRLTNFIDKVREGFIRLSPWMQKAIVIFATLLALIGPLLIAIGTIAGAILSIKGAMFILAGLGISLAAIVAVAAKVIAVIAAIGSVIGLIVDDFIVWRKNGDSVFGAIFGNFDNLFMKVKTVLGGIRQFFSAFWIAIKTNSQESWDEVVNLIFQGIKFVISKMPMLLNGLAEVFTRIMTGLGMVIIGIMDKTIGLIVGLWSRGFNFIGTLLRETILKAANKIPGLGKLLVGAGSLAKEGPKEGSFLNPGSQPFGFVPPTSIGNGGNVVNVNANITVPVPEGTPDSQRDFLQTSAEKIFDEKLNDMISKAMLANPRNEQ